MSQQPDVTPPDRLADISTHWSTLARACHHSPEVAAGAVERVLARYGDAVRRYLGASLQNPDATDEVFQEFALRLCRGDLHHADRSKGRFRNYLKTTLYHLLIDHRRREQGRPRGGVGDGLDPAVDDPLLAELDRAWLDDWRAQILDRVWAALGRAGAGGGPPLAEVLRLRTEQPDLSNAALTARLSERLGRPVTEAAARQWLHRARERFATLLLAEVRSVLRTRDDEELEQALIDLGLMGFQLVRFALERERRG